MDEGDAEADAGEGSADRMLSPSGRETEDDGGRTSAEEERCKQRILGVLKELSVFHSERVTAWREAIKECACVLKKYPPGGSDQQHSSTTDSESHGLTGSDWFSESFQSVSEVLESLTQKLNAIIIRLDAELLQEAAEDASGVDASRQEPGVQATSTQPDGDDNYLSPHEPGPPHSKHEVEEERDRCDARTSPEIERTDFALSSSEEAGKESEVKGQARDKEVSPVGQTDLVKETGEETDRINIRGEDERKSDWITVGLSGKVEDSQAHLADACFIRAPAGAAQALRCEMADAFSCLMVSGSEELVSRVIRVKVQGGAKLVFPVTVVLPFCARYRGNYRDIAVKIIDGERRTSYVTPLSTEGSYGGQRGSFAEVRVYTLGLLAVVSCLKREQYTVPRRGLSLKVPMDPRICLNYLPGSFTAPVMAQIMIQPVDAVLLTAAKSRRDVYNPVVSTSPLLYLTHPTSQPLRRPLTVTLPCPPNPDRKKDARGRGRQTERHHTGRLASTWDQPGFHRSRRLGASMKSSKETCGEELRVLGSCDEQWSLLEKVAVRNQQNGLVSFELAENFDRLLVVRLLAPPLQPCHLTSLAEELEESVGRHSVTVLLRCRQDDPRTALVSALPSRDLSWELSRLRAQGCQGGLLETSADIALREGDQLLLRFSGNITSARTSEDQNGVPHERLTFHSQRVNHLRVGLTEVDPYGNYSSPHYKGSAVFYKVARGQPGWGADKVVQKDTKLLGEPVCKLRLTLPKKARNISRPVTARVKSCEETGSLSDSLLLWLAAALSEEEVAALAASLRLRRSAAQLVKLRAGDSLSAQAFHLLAVWRRGLPAAPHHARASQLAHALAKSGRPDLAGELLQRQAAATRWEIYPTSQLPLLAV